MSEAQPTSSEADEPASPEDSSSTNTESIPREQQMVFGDKGEIEPDGDTVETSLEAFGADVDHSEGSSQVAEPKATEFGVDDRAKTSQHTDSDQYSLFADVQSGQQTLGGDDAATRCLFDNDDGDSGGEEV